MAADAIEKLETALKAWDGRYESEIYSAGHGWTVSDSPVHNPAEAERAFAKLTQLFSETLK
jgi:carboxymethylenebutenolidase